MNIEKLSTEELRLLLKAMVENLSEECCGNVLDVLAK